MRRILLTTLFSVSMSCLVAQINDFRAEYEKFQKQARQEYDDFRDECNKTYAEFIKFAWSEHQKQPAIRRPISVAPIEPLPYEDTITIMDDQLPYDGIIPVPQPNPQPKPVAPIHEIDGADVDYFSFSFYGVKCRVRLSDSYRKMFKDLSPESISDMWLWYSSGMFDNVIYDCLELRSRYRLCDYAYLCMLDKMATSFWGGKSNEASMLMAFVYCQSGYKMRLAIGDNSLVMLYASEHLIYDIPYFLDCNERYYPYAFTGDYCKMCKAGFDQEQPMSLIIDRPPMLGDESTSQRSFVSNKGINVKVSVNKNLVEFYNSYPTSEVDDEFMTRWAMYANTPLDSTARSYLYPSLKSQISGKSQLSQVELLLNFMHTAFKYERDNDVWGNDRAFFPDETLYYPSCDCEDRAILFSRIIRDILNLKTILVYYPNHLAVAVNFTDTVQGDHVVYAGEKYVVCDPTYINAPVGATMPGLDNSSAKVILLNK